MVGWHVELLQLGAGQGACMPPRGRCMLGWPHLLPRPSPTCPQIVWILFSMISGSIYFQARRAALYCATLPALAMAALRMWPRAPGLHATCAGSPAPLLLAHTCPLHAALFSPSGVQNAGCPERLHVCRGRRDSAVWRVAADGRQAAPGAGGGLGGALRCCCWRAVLLRAATAAQVC